MRPFYFIPMLLILLFAGGWLFRKPLAASGGKIFVRIFVALFAVAGAIVWTLLLLALKQLAHAWTGAGDGAGTGDGSNPPQAILLAVVVWLVPMTGFVFMLLGSLGVLKGALRRIGYWYALIFFGCHRRGDDGGVSALLRGGKMDWTGLPVNGRALGLCLRRENGKRSALTILRSPEIPARSPSH